MHLVWFALIVFIHSVICINESDVQRRYSANHPPSAEDNNPIPVSEVSQDDVISLKPHIPKYYDISLDRDIEKKVSTTKGSQLVAPIEIQEIEPIIYKNKTESETEDMLVRPTSRALSELQIPVAVIYDSPRDNTENIRAVDQEEPNIRRRQYKRVSRRKPLQNKTTAENENFTTLSTAEPQIDNVGSDTSEIQRTKPVKPQLSRTKSTKPQLDNDDSFKSETPRTKRVKSRLSRTESAKPRIDNDDYVKSEMKRTKPVKLSRDESAKLQIEIEDSVKSDTRNTKPVKLQLSRSESVKLQRIASPRQSPSHIQTTTKGEKTKRVRDPVVPIIEMENYVYAHNGNFHYSYEGGDGTKAHSEGQLRSINDAAGGEAVSGGFSYTDKDGNDFSLSYTADEHGYRPIGAHLPTPPPTPPAIARALAYLATATSPEPVTKPSVKLIGRSL